MINPNRRKDERVADIVSQFLEKNYYGQFKNYERVNDRPRQVKGIDVIFEYQGHTYLCDEKAAIRYINNPLRTFSLELYTLDRYGKPHIGWLYDDSKVNDSFLFIWVDTADKDYDSLTSPDEIQSVEVALVRKKSILRYLESIGWDEDRTMDKAWMMWDDPDEPQGNIRTDGCKFVCSRQLPEQPVNIILPRRKYIELSDHHRTITRK